jgi:hypothetical protein
MYDVRVAADEQTDGFLVIGDRPIDALGRVVKTWMILAVVGVIVFFAVAVLVNRGKFSFSLRVRVNRRNATRDDDGTGPVGLGR